MRNQALESRINSRLAMANEMLVSIISSAHHLEDHALGYGRHIQSLNRACMPKRRDGGDESGLM